MDDLFHTLASARHGPQTRGRIEGGDFSQSGMAFGAAFHAMMTEAPDGDVAPNAGRIGLAGAAPSPGGSTVETDPTPDGPLTVPPRDVDVDITNVAPQTSPTQEADAGVQIGHMSATHIAINAQFGGSTVALGQTAGAGQAGRGAPVSEGAIAATQPGTRAPVSEGKVASDTLTQRLTLQAEPGSQIKRTDTYRPPVSPVAPGALDGAQTSPLPGIGTGALNARPTTSPTAVQRQTDGPTVLGRAGSQIRATTTTHADGKGTDLRPQTTPPAVGETLAGGPNVVGHNGSQTRATTATYTAGKGADLRPQTTPPAVGETLADGKGTDLSPQTTPPAVRETLSAGQNHATLTRSEAPNTSPVATTPVARPEPSVIGPPSGVAAGTHPAQTLGEAQEFTLPDVPPSRVGRSLGDRTSAGLTTPPLSPGPQTSPVAPSVTGTRQSPHLDQRGVLEPQVIPEHRPTVGDARVPKGPDMHPTTSPVAPSIPGTPTAQSAAMALRANTSPILEARPEARDAEPRLDVGPVRTGGWSIAPAMVQTMPLSAPVFAPLHMAPAQTVLSAAMDSAMEALPDLDFSLQAMANSISTTALTPSATILSQAPSAMAQSVAQQVAAALSNANTDADTPLEIALDPPELGRVRMQISEIAGAMTLMIHAERPETAELMRRHMELLAQEFAQAGLNAPSVQISQDGAGDGGQTSADTMSEGGDARPQDADASAPQTPRNLATSDGLDLRL